jgi:hypothetical protein
MQHNHNCGLRNRPRFFLSINRTVPSRFASHVPDICPSVSDGAASGFNFHAFFANVIDMFPVILSGTTFMIRHSESYGRFEKAHFFRR